MTIPQYRSSQPLYIIIVRAQNATQLLRDWARSANLQVTVDNGRMQIFEERGLQLFQLQWPHDWSAVTIWDCWHRRHLRNE
jgi:hypothetical protein